MFNFTNFANFQQSPNQAERPRFTDFFNYDHQMEHNLTLWNYLIAEEPVSNHLLDQQQPQTVAPARINNVFPFLMFSRQTDNNYDNNFLMNIPPQNVVEVQQQKTSRKKNLQTKKILQTCQCSICLLDMKKNSKIPKLPCGHEFHKKCLVKWFQKQENCPLCRLDLSCLEQ